MTVDYQFHSIAQQIYLKNTENTDIRFKSLIKVNLLSNIIAIKPVSTKKLIFNGINTYLLINYTKNVFYKSVVIKIIMPPYLLLVSC